MRTVAKHGVIAALVCGVAAPAFAQREDELSAKRESVPELLSDGYRVAGFATLDRGESRLILKKRYNLVYCIVEEGSADDESLELESVCYRLR